MVARLLSYFSFICIYMVAIMKPYGYVYISTNLINGRQYIGQKKSTKFLGNYFGSGKIIRQAIKQYGKEQFSVKLIEWCQTVNEANEKEIFYINKFNAVDDLRYYNIMSGGLCKTSRKGQKNTKEHNEKVSKALKGKPKSEHHKQQLSKAKIGHVLSDITKQKMSASHKGLLKGIPKTEAHKEKLKGKRGKQKIVKCPHCGVVGGLSGMNRYHFNNCK